MDDDFKGLTEALAAVEKSFGIVLDTEIDDNGDGTFFFDTNYTRKTFETETEANDFENKYQETACKWCKQNGYTCNRSEDEDAPLAFWIDKINAAEEIEKILTEEFGGKAVLNSEKDGEFEFSLKEWQEQPNDFDLEDKISEAIGKDVSVEYDRYNDEGEADDEGETISVFISASIKESAEDGESFNVSLKPLAGQDGDYIYPQLCKYQDFERAKKYCDYSNKHSKRFAGRFVVMDGKMEKIVYPEDK